MNYLGNSDKTNQNYYTPPK